MKKASTINMTEGSPLRLLISFMIPIMIGELFQSLYNMADMLVIGRFLGDEAIAGVGAAGSVYSLISGFCIGLCNGFAVPISHSFGANDHRELRRYFGNIIWISAAFATFFTLVATIFCRNILILTNVPSDVIGYSSDYIFIIFCGIPILFAFNALASVMRALGDSRSPVYFLTVSSILNVVLNLIFVAIFSMGVVGTAIATVIAQLCSLILCIFKIAKSQDLLRITRDDLRPSKAHLKVLCEMGIPTALQTSITNVGGVAV